MDTPSGPIRLMKNADGSTTYNMGARGSFTLKFDGETRSMHMEASTIYDEGFRHDDDDAGRWRGTPDC